MRYTPLLSLPSVSLIGKSNKQKVEHLFSAGWNGIELFMFRGHDRDVNEIREHGRGLRLSFHQPWSLEESGGIAINVLLNAVGYLPKDGYSLSSLAKHGCGELMIVYADRFDEVIGGNEHRVEYAFQTACCWKGRGNGREHRLSYREFHDRIVEGSSYPIVFDTFHVLEWRLNSVGKRLADLDERMLERELIAAWKEIGPERIVEIHWNDVDGKGLDGRCLPGNGKLAAGLRRLARELRAYGWGGYVVPEVSPFTLVPFPTRSLSSLRKRMFQFFE